MGEYRMGSLTASRAERISFCNSALHGPFFFQPKETGSEVSYVFAYFPAKAFEVGKPDFSS